ncbi:MAG: Kelch repeat-containing protein [Dehalococcoidia bacterium]
MVAGGHTPPATGGRAAPDPTFGLFDPGTNRWSLGEHALACREAHTATLLRDGRVLFAGGSSSRGGVQAGDAIYDPGAATWQPAPPSLVSREYAATVALTDGRVLVAGGQRTYPAGTVRPPEPGALTDTELYDPTANTFVRGGAMRSVRVWHEANREPPAVALPGGDALVFGGTNPLWTPNDTAGSGERYRDADRSWSLLPRGPHDFIEFVAPLSDGRVLVMGAVTIRDDARRMPAKFGFAAAFFEPSAGTWATVMMPADFPPAHCVLCLLPDGRVLASGGERDDDPSALDTAFLCTPATGQVTAAEPMRRPRRLHTATALPDGRVLVVGGQDPSRGGPFIPSELFDPSGGHWTPAK